MAAPTLLYAQPDTLWTNTLQQGGWVAQTILRVDGGYATGTFYAGNEGRGDDDFYIMGLDSVGSFEWGHFYAGHFLNGQHNGDTGMMIAQTSDGGFVFGGNSGGTVLIRTDASGDSVWMRYFRYEDGYPGAADGEQKCLITPDSNIVFCCRNWLIKVADADGEIIWAYEYADSINFTCLVNTTDDGLFAAGYVGRWRDSYAAKLDGEGNIDWDQTYGMEDADLFIGVTGASSGGWCLAGLSRSGDGAYELHPYIVRINEQGEEIWNLNIEDWDGWRPRDIVETPDGGFAITGLGPEYFCLFRLDYSGGWLWRALYGDWGHDDIPGQAYSLMLMKDGGYTMAGFSQRGTLLIRTDPDPVDLPFELEPAEDSHDFGVVELDSISIWQLSLFNSGDRYAIIDSITFDDTSGAFSYLDQLPIRIEPTDTFSFTFIFQPEVETDYQTVSTFWFGDTSLDISMEGRGEPNAVVVEDTVLPRAIEISINPNPFNSVTSIAYGLPKAAKISLKVFDLMGGEVATLFEGYQRAGGHRVVWQGVNQRKLPVSSGVYFVRLDSGQSVRTQKLMLIR